jgi:N-acetylmuramidase-like protein
VTGTLPVKPDTPTVTAWLDAAASIGCELRAIRAVAKVEAGSEGAFLDSGEPVILFERHIFHRLTDGRFDGAVAPGVDIASSQISVPVRGGYGRASIQHAKLAAAVLLDREAALKSCSWGLFQIMGLNHESAGFQDLQEFVNAMYRSADDHLAAFVSFIKSDSRMVGALRSKDWHAFARIYNGPATSGYDSRIAWAYRELPLEVGA